VELLGMTRDLEDGFTPLRRFERVRLILGLPL